MSWEEPRLDKETRRLGGTHPPRTNEPPSSRAGNAIWGGARGGLRTHKRTRASERGHLRTAAHRRVAFDVPHADGLVVGCAEEVARAHVVPRQAVPFLGVPLEPQLRAALPARVGHGRVLGVVKNEHVRGRCLGCDNVGVLRHVARPVDLALMVDLHFDFDLAARGTEPADLCAAAAARVCEPRVHGRRGKGSAPKVCGKGVALRASKDAPALPPRCALRPQPCYSSKCARALGVAQERAVATRGYAPPFSSSYLRSSRSLPSAGSWASAIIKWFCSSPDLQSAHSRGKGRLARELGMHQSILCRHGHRTRRSLFDHGTPRMRLACGEAQASSSAQKREGGGSDGAGRAGAHVCVPRIIRCVR